MGCSQSQQNQIKEQAEKAKADHDKKDAVAPENGEFGPGASLAKEQEVQSTDGRWKLVHQSDGNVVLYHIASDSPKWSTETNGKETTSFIFQEDGNLVLYAGEEAVWSSETNGKDGKKVALQGDGNIVMYTEGGEAVWTSNTDFVHPELPVDQKLYKHDYLQSANGEFKFTVQGDGNLVLYKGDDAKWSSETAGKDMTHFLFQADGNLVLYNDDEPVWSSGSCGDADKFIVQDDGNVVLYSGDEPKWSTGTNE